MLIAVLFDGAGLARLGLEQAGHECVGFEIDPWKHYLAKHLCKSESVLANATQVDLANYKHPDGRIGFDAVWASPPCQLRSFASSTQLSNGATPMSVYAGNYIEWCIDNLSSYNTFWIENVMTFNTKTDPMLFHSKLSIREVYNASQFTPIPLQNRNRIIAGRYIKPKVFRRYRKTFTEAIPCIMASEYHGSRTDGRRASRHFGRKLTINECAFYQGLTSEQIHDWLFKPSDFPGDRKEWQKNIYEAIGNGVPVYMARAFGEATRYPDQGDWIWT